MHNTRHVNTQRSDCWKADVFIKGAVRRAKLIRRAIDGSRAIGQIVIIIIHNRFIESQK